MAALPKVYTLLLISIKTQAFLTISILGKMKEEIGRHSRLIFNQYT